MRNRKEELIQYLKTLMQLKEIGIRCDKKIEVVLNELHKEMGFVSGEMLSITIPQPNDEEVKRIAKEISEKIKKIMRK